MTGPDASSIDDPRELLAPLRDSPSTTVLAFDFDGTLSAVVDDPAAAVPLPGVADALADLAERYRSVAVLSGRPVSFLASRLHGAVVLSGLYGLEQGVGGWVADHPDAAAWRPVVTEAVAASEQATAPGAPLEGIHVEGKGLSLTLHARVRPDLEPALVAFAEDLGEGLGLEVRPAKRSVELHPPIAADKGTALLSLVAEAGATGVLYVGDDVGDLPALDAVADLVGTGAVEVGVRLVVGGPELPEAVRSRADAILSGPATVLELLAALRS